MWIVKGFKQSAWPSRWYELEIETVTKITKIFYDIMLFMFKRRIMVYYVDNASIKSKREIPPPGKPPGNFFEVVKSPAPGQNFPAKARPPGQKTPTPGEYFRRSSQPFLLTGVEILGFFRNQLLKRIERLSYYSLVIPSSFSLSTILKVLKFPPSFETDFVTRE